MSGYIFRQRCRPRGDFRIDEIIDYFGLMREAFGFPILYDKRSKPVEVEPDVLERIFERHISKGLRSVGVTVDFYSLPPRNRDDNTVRFEVTTGTHPDEVFVDRYDIVMYRWRIPDFKYFEKSIEIFKPFEAFLAEDDNETRTDAYMRQQTIDNFSKPAIIRGFHYLDKDLARSIGGIDYCLKAPGWHVERFCEGVLIELVPGPFDSNSPEHLKVQEEVMDYFDLW
ncbi:MAG: hypothetical protein HY914_05245 [Desulfomonile tiedjei]|nr:hypothetical protein [Desulfomonile tiedjei]